MKNIINQNSKSAVKPAALHNYRPGIQAKLEVGQPNDHFEQEADAVANKVMRMPDQNFVQRKCAECEKEDKVHRKPLSENITPFVQAKSESNTPIVSDTSARSIQSSKGSGGAMDSQTNSFMSSRFGTNFSSVKIHADSEAAQLSNSLQAKAFTVGNDIYFNEGQYSPNSSQGKQLLAHELTHTLQQSTGVQRKPFGSRPDYASIPIDYEMISDPEERMEMMRADYERISWKIAMERLEKGELDDADLQYGRLMNRLTGLTTTEIDSLITKIKAFQAQRDKDVKDPKVIDPDKKKPVSTGKIIEWLEVRKVISTPMPTGATVGKDPITQGIVSYSLTVNGVFIKVVEDTFGNAGNDTGPTTNLGRNYSWHAGSNGIVDKLENKDSATPISVNPMQLEVTIVTRYKDNPNDPSGYGKGTTESDKYNQTTTLRVHEGQHGTDYIDYIRKTPFSVDLSKGIVGVLSVADMRKVDEFIKNITKSSCETTDQIGFSQDEFLKTPAGKASKITSCRKTP